MTVCMVVYSFYEVDNRVRRYAETLASRGDRVDVICLRRDGQSSYEEIRGVHVYRVQHRTVNEKNKLRYLLKLLLFFFNSMQFLARNHFRNPYDLIHVHSVPDFEVFAAWVPKLMGAKIILDIHDLVPEFYMSKFNAKRDSMGVKGLLFVERMSAAFADHVIIANHLWRERLLSRSVAHSRCTTIVNFPDLSIFHPIGRTRIDDKFIILYPGTLNYHQGVDVAVRAFAHIKDKAPHAEFHIYGEGPLKEAILDLISQTDLRDRVFLKKRVPLHLVPALIENADLGVVPKRSESFGDEAFSTKIMEFMSLGVPVIVSETKVDRYYFDDSLVKFFRSGDEKELGESMLLLIRDKELRQRLAKNAEEFIQHNNWDLKKSEYLAIVDSLVARSHGQTKRSWYL